MFFEPFGSSEVSNENVVPGLYIEIMVSAVLMESDLELLDIDDDRLATVLTQEVVTVFGERIEMSPIVDKLTTEKVHAYIEQHKEHLSEYIRRNREGIEHGDLVVCPTDTLRNYEEWHHFTKALGELDLFQI